MKAKVKKKQKKGKKDKNQLIEDTINIKIKNLEKLEPAPEVKTVFKVEKPKVINSDIEMFNIGSGVIRITE